ncbi:hypothetical protein [Pendulispora albinea]|uniref:Uncharacterized protein n=1 Tax=Pendulispora albinea TaxID=2741071 RepID=A0ABZ2LQC9_9BACT
MSLRAGGGARLRFDLAIVGIGSLALLLYARSFRFFCDDAFISLRYARNFATLGAPVYNAGERVEGYTSFAWMAITALFMRAGLDGVAAAQVAGALSGVFLVASTWWLWTSMEPEHPWVGVFVIAGLALSAPVAAWTLGGLETPLFAALVVASIGVVARVAGSPSRSSGVWAGAAFAVSTLARPEGAALFAVVVIVVAVFAARRPLLRCALADAVLTYSVLVGAFVAWRWWYYGAPLPNTFYLKMSGERPEMLRRGLRYLSLALRDFGPACTVTLLACMLVPARPAGQDAPDDRGATVRRTTLWIARIFTAVMIGYVAWIGGDFLDLDRFLVPLFPLIAVVVGAAACRALELLSPAIPPVALSFSLLCATLFPYAVRQSTTLNQRARAISEPTRADADVEPLGWTALYARRWAAMGRWIAAHAQPDDWMATGAAGAMPFYAGIRNLDRLGLCDAYVARAGEKLSDRPGHQRVAPLSYTLSKDPVFLMIDDAALDAPEPPPRDPYWESKGYVWMVVRLDARYGASPPSWHKFLMRKDRAAALIPEDGVESALTAP